MIEPSNHRHRAFQIAVLSVVLSCVLGLAYLAPATAIEQRQEYIEQCDERYGENGWVLVENEESWTDTILYQGRTGPTKCVDIDSPRAEDCVVTHLITDYNDRCADLRD